MLNEAFGKDYIQNIELFLDKKVYPVQGIQRMPTPNWIEDNLIDDLVYELTMPTSQLAEDIDNQMAGSLSQYIQPPKVNIELTNKVGHKAAIVDATVTSFYQREVVVLGGIYVSLDRGVYELPGETQNRIKRIQQREIVKPNIKRFRIILDLEE